MTARGRGFMSGEIFKLCAREGKERKSRKSAENCTATKFRQLMRVRDQSLKVPIEIRYLTNVYWTKRDRNRKDQDDSR